MLMDFYNNNIIADQSKCIMEGVWVARSQMLYEIVSPLVHTSNYFVVSEF